MSASRLKYDPAKGVMDLQKVIIQYLKQQALCLKHPIGAAWSWKTAPCVRWIAQASERLLGFIKVAPNGLLPSSMLKLCLQRMLADPQHQQLNETEYHQDDFIDQVDNRIRVLLSQCRSLKKSDACLASMKKATEEERGLGALSLKRWVPHQHQNMKGTALQISAT